MGKVSYADDPVPKPSMCTYCGNVEPTTEHWLWHKDNRQRDGGRWRCRARHRGQTRSAVAKYRESNRTYERYRHYLSKDLARGRPGTPVSWPTAKEIMKRPCSHCGKSESGGLDRIDNALAHTQDNVVPSCGTCNMLLLDMPIEMKNEISLALRRARKKGLMDLWQHPRLR